MNINRRILATIFVTAAALTVVVVASTWGISIITPAFAQDGNMTTGGGNATEGNMTAPDIAGSGVATPPVTTP